MWCPGSGVVIDCIDSRSLPSSLQWKHPMHMMNEKHYIYIATHQLSDLNLGCSKLNARMLFPLFIIATICGLHKSLSSV